MGEYSLDDLNAAKDVVWDFEVSSGLASKLDAAATSVEGMVAPRNSRQSTYGTKFEGYYAELWSRNVETANRDAELLTGGLRNVARGVRDLGADARAEQQRIDAAKEWKRKRDERSDLEKAWETVDFLHLFHGDANPPRVDPVPQMSKSYEPPVLEERSEFVGQREGGVSSALPDDLRSFTREERAATDLVRDLPGTLRGLVTDFQAKCFITAFPTQWPPLRATPGELALRNELALATSNLGER